MKPEHLDGDYSVLWSDLQAREGDDGKVRVGPDEFQKVRELEQLGGCQVTSEDPNEMILELVHQPEETPDNRIEAAAKPTKFAKK